MAKGKRQTAPPSFANQWLQLADDAGEGPHPGLLHSFRQFILVYGAARSWLWLTVAPDGHGILACAALVLSLACAMAFIPRVAYMAPRVGLAALALQLWWHFPFNANHFFLELLCVILLCFARRDDAEAEALTLQGLRWLTAIVFFHTGLQKVLYGLYFHGDFLALMVGTQERFARFFQFLLPEGEVARLASYDNNRTGAGPYRVQAPLFLLASNLVYVAEMGLPFLLIWLRTRWVGTLLTLGFMLTIQLGALEIGFAFLFLNLLFLFLPGNWCRRLLPWIAVVLLYAVGAGFGFLPGDPRGWNLY